MSHPHSRAQSKRATLLKLLGDIESLEANLKVSSAPRTTTSAHFTSLHRSPLCSVGMNVWRC
jgi:hypothetical protein